MAWKWQGPETVLTGMPDRPDFDPPLPVPTVHSGHRKRLIEAGAGACPIRRPVLSAGLH